MNIPHTGDWEAGTTKHCHASKKFDGSKEFG